MGVEFLCPKCQNPILWGSNHCPSCGKKIITGLSLGVEMLISILFFVVYFMLLSFLATFFIPPFITLLLIIPPVLYLLRISRNGFHPEGARLVARVNENETRIFVPLNDFKNGERFDLYRRKILDKFITR